MIYFVRQTGTNLVKIGYARHSAEERMQVLQIGCPTEMELLGSMAGDRKTERALHTEFESARFRNEWFKMVPELAVRLANTNPDFAELAALEPRLLDIARQIGTVDYHHGFCASAFWYGYGGYEGIKPQVVKVVGLERMPPGFVDPDPTTAKETGVWKISFVTAAEMMGQYDRRVDAMEAAMKNLSESDQAREHRLRTSEAYDAVTDTLYNLLPDCQDCNCM